MSATTKAIPAPDVAARKGGARLECLTARTTPMARIVDARCDAAPVAHSLGMMLHGLPSTLGVTMEMMILHGHAVRRGLSRAGAFAVAPEKTPAALADRITAGLTIPAIGIGIGASAACDGQIPATQDMLGMFTDFRPEFVTREAELGAEADHAVAASAACVRDRTFPGPDHVLADAAPAPR